MSAQEVSSNNRARHSVPTFFRQQKSHQAHPRWPLESKEIQLKQPEAISYLQDAIRSIHGCEAKYSRTVLIREAFRGDIAWDGFVRVFALIDCPTAKHCFAWRYRDGKEIKTFAVLEIPPVDSPEAAIKVAITKKAREK